MSEVTRLLCAIEEGDARAAQQLLPLVYDELRKLAGATRRENPAVRGHSRRALCDRSGPTASDIDSDCPKDSADAADNANDPLRITDLDPSGALRRPRLAAPLNDRAQLRADFKWFFHQRL